MHTFTDLTCGCCGKPATATFDGEQFVASTCEGSCPIPPGLPREVKAVLVDRVRAAASDLRRSLSERARAEAERRYIGDSGFVQGSDVRELLHEVADYMDLHERRDTMTPTGWVNLKGIAERLDAPAPNAQSLSHLRVDRGAALLDRSSRQIQVAIWCVAAFGDDHAKSIEQRGIRLVEEAVEAAQACGCDPAMIHRLVDHVYAKPIGKLDQEIGGVGVTLLALADAAGVSADEAEMREIHRIHTFPLEHFAARNAAKNAAGFNVLARNRENGEPALTVKTAPNTSACTSGVGGDLT